MTTAIIQARMGSTRFPGKVLKLLDGKPVLGWVCAAVDRAKMVDRIVVATSTLPADNAIEAYIKNTGIAHCFRGSETDVLDRFYKCSQQYTDNVYLRLTGDCPFLDPSVIDQVVALRSMLGIDYASNVDPPTWPDGLDVECFTGSTLEIAWKEATRQSDRDCLTQYITRNRYRFKAANLTCPLPGMHKERWVLDTEDDYKLCKEIAEKTGLTPSYTDILKILDEHPEYRLINSAPRNERFYAEINKEETPPRKFTASSHCLSRALKTIPFGAQTFSKSHIQYPSMRAPLYVSHADGARIFDVDGNDYIDLVSGLLPVVLGYRDPDVDEAIRRQLDNGISFSLSTTLEAELSELLCHHIPCAEMVKFGKSGTDVTTAAIRAARAYTGKSHVFLGGYHGWSDWSMSTTDRNAGILKEVGVFSHKLDMSYLATTSEPNIAAIIVEPDMWDYDHLLNLRKFCTSHGIILIFDEIITGFRFPRMSYQKHVGITPDLATFGKAMANGMPISAVVGRKDIMNVFQPPDNIFYSGTFFGETLSMAAAIATIKKIERDDVIGHICKEGAYLSAAIEHSILNLGLSGIVELSGHPSRKIISFHGEDQQETDQIRTLFMAEMIQAGVLIINSNNISFAHKRNEMIKVHRAYERALTAIVDAFDDEKLEERAGEITAVSPLRKTV
jgi:glutamate-1-semialdehyde aminotransferase/spore coat polysaccharide biosynthesis protein SpsF (cytidylyltransferase family)